MSIYTKTGDSGKTSLFEIDPIKRKRVSKSSLKVEVIGAIDEANSYLGVANTFAKNKNTISFVKQVQKELFQIGAIVSCAPLQLNNDAVLLIEQQIDKLEEDLPPLRNFLLPEGSISATHFMYARALVRKAERRIVNLSKKEKLPDEILRYINRLSDYLFMVFRDENRLAKKREEIWKGKGS